MGSEMCIRDSSDPVDFRDICKTLQAVDKEIRPMIKNIWTITRIVLTSGATSATRTPRMRLLRKVICNVCLQYF